MDEIFTFSGLVMPEHQLMEKNGKIAKTAILDLAFFSEWACTIKVNCKTDKNSKNAKDMVEVGWAPMIPFVRIFPC